MELKDAKAQANAALNKFRGVELTTEVLNDIENTVNSLIFGWAKNDRYFVKDNNGRLVKGIKLWYDLFNGSLKFAFRYLR